MGDDRYAEKEMEKATRWMNHYVTTVQGKRRLRLMQLDAGIASLEQQIKPLQEELDRLREQRSQLLNSDSVVYGSDPNAPAPKIRFGI